MPTFWIVLGAGAVLAVLIGSGYLAFRRIERTQGNAFGAVLDTLTERLTELRGDSTDSLPADVKGTLAALERRMEQLEADALSYLRKGSQRYELARRRENRLAASEGLDDDDDDGNATEQDREQLELALSRGGENGGTGRGGVSIESIRALINRG